MLTKFEAVNAQARTLAFSFRDPTEGFVVREIEGLGPVRATIVSSSFAQLDGTEEQSVRRENRNIVIKLGLEPDYSVDTVQTLRNRLYGHFMTKSWLTLKFYVDDIHFVNISGRIESCEPNLFTRDPEVVISILCFDPDFVATGPVVYSGFTTQDTTDQLIAYPGTTETGFVLKLWVSRSVSGLMIYNTPEGGRPQWFEFTTALGAGDVLEISTIAGAKRARVSRNGSDISVLYGVSPSSSWLNLYPGTNSFRLVASGAPLPFTIEYLAKYGGL